MNPLRRVRSAGGNPSAGVISRVMNVTSGMTSGVPTGARVPGAPRGKAGVMDQNWACNRDRTRLLNCMHAPLGASGHRKRSLLELRDQCPGFPVVRENGRQIRAREVLRQERLHERERHPQIRLRETKEIEEV